MLGKSYLWVTHGIIYGQYKDWRKAIYRFYVCKYYAMLGSVFAFFSCLVTLSCCCVHRNMNCYNLNILFCVLSKVAWVVFCIKLIVLLIERLLWVGSPIWYIVFYDNLELFIYGEGRLSYFFVYLRTYIHVNFFRNICNISFFLE